MIEIFNESNERPYQKELDEQYVRELGSLGLYDAQADFYTTSPQIVSKWPLIEE